MPSRGSHKNSHKQGCQCTPAEIKTVHELIFRSPAPKKEIHYELTVMMGYEITESTLASYGEHRRHMPAHLVVPISLAARNMVYLDFLARQSGRECPRPTTPNDESPASILRKALNELGRNIQQIARTVPDAPLDAVEQQRLAYSLDRLREVADSFVIRVTTPPPPLDIDRRKRA